MSTEDQITSTPEKNTDGLENITAISEISSHFQDNIKQLTPIEDLNNLKYHDKAYLDTVISKASRGDTFFPQSTDKDNYKFANTPSFNKSPSKINYLASTPLVDDFNNNKEFLKPLQFNIDKKTRNIFNLSPEFISHQPGLKLSTNNDGSINPIKGAFNIFDKNSSFASGTSSIGSKKFRRSKKRSRGSNISDLSFDLTNNSSRIINNNNNNNSLSELNLLQKNKSTSFSKHQQYQQNKDINIISKYEYFHTLISDPQCISNLTLIIQVLLNTLMVLIFLGFSLVAFFAIKRDVDHKIASYVNDSIHKINSCKREYLRNNCAPEMRVPALEYKCNEWDTCMSQNPESVITSMAYFEVLADCMNAFFHNISIKSLSGIGCLMIFCIIVPNILFSKFRSTTINQNYYNHNNNKYNNDNDLSNIQTSSPLKLTNRNNNINDSFNNNNNNNNIRSSGIKSLTTQNSNQQILPITNDIHNNANISGSVRFNPNVSYSMYDYEEEEDNDNNKNDNLNDDNNNDYDDDDENLLANQRIILDE